MTTEKENINNDDLTLKDIINLVIKYFHEVKKYWILPLAFGILFAGYKGYKAYAQKATYKATLTFMINEDEGAKLGGGAASILGRLGGTTAKFNLDKILELSKSRNIVQQALFSKIAMDKKEDYFANHFIKAYDLNKNSKNPIVFSRDDVDKFTDAENAMLQKIYIMLVGPEGLVSNSSNDKSGIMTMTISTVNELLSIEFLKKLYDKLSNFYISKSIEKEQVAYNALKTKSERLYAQMNSKEAAKASFDDSNLSVFQESSKLPGKRYERDARILGAIYAEVIKNLELAEISLQNKTPFVQVIDYPIPPLEPQKDSLLKSILLGLLLGGIIGITVVIIRKIFQEAMA